MKNVLSACLFTHTNNEEVDQDRFEKILYLPSIKGKISNLNSHYYSGGVSALKTKLKFWGLLIEDGQKNTQKGLKNVTPIAEIGKVQFKIMFKLVFNFEISLMSYGLINFPGSYML